MSQTAVGETHNLSGDIIGTDSTGCCKSNYHAISITMAFIFKATFSMQKG
jgi:hypothetical protein